MLYLRGWLRARITRPAELPAWRALCFLSGLVILWLALASPLDALDDFLLTAHMLQHLVLISVAPPLLVLGAPVVPLLRGIPRTLRKAVLRPILQTHWFHPAASFVAHPVFGWVTMNAAYLAWHTPPAYELTLRSEPWHNFEHFCFFSTSLLFWWNVLLPWPARARWSRWAVVPYLVAADLVNTGLSAFLCFSGRVLYPTYQNAPRIFALSPLNDQVAAGAGMWVFGSVSFLLPAVLIPALLLSHRSAASRTQPRTHS